MFFRKVAMALVLVGIAASVNLGVVSSALAAGGADDRLEDAINKYQRPNTVDIGSYTVSHPVFALPLNTQPGYDYRFDR